MLETSTYFTLPRGLKNYFVPLFFILLLSACKKDPIPTLVPPNVAINGEIGSADNSTILSNDGNLILCGSNNGAQFITKVSPTGTEIWRKEYVLGNSPFASAVVESSTGELYMTASNSRLVKLTSTGDTLWTKTIGSGYSMRDLAVATNGSILLATSNWDDPAVSELINVDEAGNLLWNTTLTTNNVTQLTACSNGEIIVIGFSGNGLTGQHLVISKLAVNGSELWTIQPSNLPSTMIVSSAFETSSGNIMMCGFGQNSPGFDSEGHIEPVSSGPTYSYLYAIDLNGNILLTKQIGSGKGVSVQRNLDDSYTLIGHLDSENFITKYDQDGHQLWLKLMGSNSITTLANLQTNAANENFVTGNIGERVFLMRTNSLGDFE